MKIQQVKERATLKLMMSESVTKRHLVQGSPEQPNTSPRQGSTKTGIISEGSMGAQPLHFEPLGCRSEVRPLDVRLGKGRLEVINMVAALPLKRLRFRP